MYLVYFKCAWANPYTRFGYLFILIGSFDLSLRLWGAAAVFLSLGALFLWATNLGKGTVAGYLATRKRLARTRGPSPYFMAYILEGTPCILYGFKLALEEHERKMRREARR